MVVGPSQFGPEDPLNTAYFPLEKAFSAANGRSRGCC